MTQCAVPKVPKVPGTGSQKFPEPSGTVKSHRISEIGKVPEIPVEVPLSTELRGTREPRNHGGFSEPVNGCKDRPRLTIHVPVRTHNELNAKRCHWRTKHAQRAAVKEAVTYALIGHRWLDVPKPTALAPWLVRLVRLGPREMDDDGVVSALKSVRDAFAHFVAVNDKHKHIVRYEYSQEPSKTFGVRIEVRGYAI